MFLPDGVAATFGSLIDLCGLCNLVFASTADTPFRASGLIKGPASHGVMAEISARHFTGVVRPSVH